MKIRIGTIYRVELIKHFRLTEFIGPVLDVGCHDNTNLSEIKAPIKIGIDLERGDKIDGINFVQADAKFLPFKSNCFEQIFMMDVIEHIEDERDLSASLFRVLKPSGNIFLTTPSKAILLNPWFLTKYISEKWGHYYRLGYTEDELSELFSDEFNLLIDTWNAQWWRFFYLFLRSTIEIFPKFGISLVKRIFALDARQTEGVHGYLTLKGKKKL